MRLTSTDFKKRPAQNILVLEQVFLAVLCDLLSIQAKSNYSLSVLGSL